MLFVGEYKHTIDAKNRLFIPAKYRDMLGESFYITRKMEKCLAIYSEAEWSKLTDKLNTLPDSVVGSIKQFLYSKTISATPDSQGRVVLPPNCSLMLPLTKTPSSSVLAIICKSGPTSFGKKKKTRSIPKPSWNSFVNLVFKSARSFRIQI